MTSPDLIDYINEHQVFGALKENVEVNEIYRCGNLAQSEILRECELLEEYPSPTFVGLQEIYAPAISPAPLTGWEFLLHTVRVKSGTNNDSPFQAVEVKDKDWVDGERIKVANGWTQPTPPKFCYHILGNPLQVGFWGVPQSATIVNLTTVRGHGVADNLTDSINPLIPIGYEDLMVLGTIVKLLRNRMTFEVTATARGKMLPSQLTLAYQFFANEFAQRKIEAKLTRTTVKAETVSFGRMKIG